MEIVSPPLAPQARASLWLSAGHQTLLTWSGRQSGSPTRAGACRRAGSPHALGSRPYVSVTNKTTHHV